MARIHGDVLIARPPEAVFDFVADERNEPRFNRQMVTSSLESAEPIGEGSRFKATFRSVGRLIPMSVELTRYERPRRLASHSSLRGAEIDGELTFDPEGEGTRMRWSWEVRPHGLARPFDLLIARMGEHLERRIWGALKALLEQGEPGAEGLLERWPPRSYSHAHRHRRTPRYRFAK